MGPGVMGGGTFPRDQDSTTSGDRPRSGPVPGSGVAGAARALTMVGPPTLEPRIYAPIPALLIGTMVKHPNPTGITPVYGAELMIMETIRKIACPNI